MNTLGLIDYALILVFFAAVLCLIVIIGRRGAVTATAQKAGASCTSTSFQNKKLSYALLGVLFVLFLALTMVIEKEQTKG
jgi:hypothetical protein